MAACVGGGEAPPLHATLDLAAATTPQPWAARPGAPAANAQQLTVRFVLEPAQVGRGSALVLEGLWWSATATVNGVALPSVTGGNAPAEVPVGPHLRAGENTVVLDLAPPTTEQPIEHGGGLASSSFARDRPTLQAPPRLVVRPETHLKWATLRAEGDAVVPVAQTAAPVGSQVEFVWAGGRQTATVDEAGRAEGAPVPWSGPWWAPGAPALVPLTTTLRATAEGAVFDRLTERVGVRAVHLADGQVLINGTSKRLVGARVTNRPDLGAFPDRLGALLPAGVNALEIHGELPRTSWLELADEVGLPVVFVPRCVGRTRRGSRPTPASLQLQQDQDDRFLASLADNPSVLMWVGEGPAPRTQTQQPVPIVMWTEHLLTDPLQRPIVQHHLPDRFLQTEPPGPDGVVHHSCQREPCANTWLVEVTWEGPTVPAMWPAMATAFAESLSAGAIGGVIPTPERHDVGSWRAAFQPVLARAGVTPAQVDGHRASALLSISGGTPGETVWVSGEGVPARGAIFDARGAAEVAVWADGPVTVTAGGQTQTVAAEPRIWAALRPTGDATPVAVGPPSG